MSRPLVSVALSYAAGLLAGYHIHAPLPALFALAFATLLLAIFLGQFRHMLTCLLLALTGWVNYSMHAGVIRANDLRQLTGTEISLTSVRGELLETPDVRVYLRDEELIQRCVVKMRATEMRRNGVWIPAAGEIVVTTPGLPGKEFFLGQSVEIEGALGPPRKPMAEGLFDYRAHLAKLGIHHLLKVHSTNGWRLGIAPLPGPPFATHFVTWAEKVLTTGLDPGDESTQLLLAMTLGKKAGLTDEVSEPFMCSGTMHIFAISGLHIALLAGILIALFRAARLPRLASGLLVLPMIWFYTGATGWQPSAIRSTLMMSVIIGGWSLNRPTDLLNSLSAAGLIILGWDPLQLFQASFQLSFFVVLSIALFMPPLERLCDQYLKTDPMRPEELLSLWRRRLNGLLKLLAKGLATSLAAWLGSLPLTAYYFHIFNPVTLPANLLIVPLSSLALAANLGAMMSGTWLPFLAEILNNSAWFFMRLMVVISEAAMHFPCAWMNMPAPPAAAVACYYALLIGISSRWAAAKWRRGILGAGAGALLALGIWHWHGNRGETLITVLPLNGGHAVHVDASGLKTDWLINCGNTEAVDFILKDHLRAKGVNQIPRLALGNASLRNCGGATNLDLMFGVTSLWTSHEKFRSTSYRDAVGWFQAEPARHRWLNCGDSAPPWKILFPSTGTGYFKADDRPLVFMGGFFGTKILLLSDLSRGGQSDLLSLTNDLRADIVVAGLPAEGEPLCGALIEAIQPHLIIIADSELPATRRASPALQDRLRATGIPVLFTHKSGAVTLVANNTGCHMRTMDGQTFSLARGSEAKTGE